MGGGRGKRSRAEEGLFFEPLTNEIACLFRLAGSSHASEGIY